MVDRQIFDPLPADLPEDWNAGQTIAPTGEEVGLSRQHGYNYLMEMVNKAQRGVNLAHETLETVGGKRSCRFTVGTTASGWTAADCDYLCDGVDDQVEINQAFSALPGGGGEVVLLDGTYSLSGYISVKGNSILRGCGMSTNIIRTKALAADSYYKGAIIRLSIGAELRDLSIDSDVDAADNAQITSVGENVITGIAINKSMTSKASGVGIYTRQATSKGTHIETCSFGEVQTAVLLIYNARRVKVMNCFVREIVDTFIGTDDPGTVTAKGVSEIEVFGNFSDYSDIRLDAVDPVGGDVLITGNSLQSIQIAADSQVHSTGTKATGNLIANNVFVSPPGDNYPFAIILGAATSGWFVACNQIRDLLAGTDSFRAIIDDGEMNDVRFNSNDAGGSSGGGGATVYGIPSGGSSGQILAKRSGTNYDAGWIDPPSGGSSGGVTMEMVNAAIQSAAKNVVSSLTVGTIQLLTEDEYNALATKSEDALYLIKE